MYRNSDSRIIKHIRHTKLTGILKENISFNVLDVMLGAPRHFFVSEALRYKAYDDTSLPIGFGQTISKPSIIAHMVDALGLKGNERVLEIGTGSGYQSAILAECCRSLVTLERIKELSLRARNVLFSLKYTNVKCLHTDDFNDAEGVFDAVIIAAGVDIFPVDLLRKLVVGGILVIPLGNSSGHVIKKIVKTGDDDFITNNIGEATFVPYITGECA